MKNQYTKKSECFCIIKYSVWVLSCKEIEYAMLRLTGGGFYFSTTVISPKKAREIIAEFNMVKKVDNRYGCVWETPGKSFKRRYKGDLQTKLNPEAAGKRNTHNRAGNTAVSENPLQ
jgi:hypothetical protein